MDISQKRIIADLRVYEAAGVSREHGRACRKALEKTGEIKPRCTPTGRCYLTVKDAERLAAAL